MASGTPGIPGSTPDLQAILATLARFAPPVQAQEASQNPEYAPVALPTGDGLSGSPDTRRSDAYSVDGRPVPHLTAQTHSVTAATAAAAPKPIDPATITIWQDGLRCVTKIAAQNDQFAASIRKMMKDQRAEEMRWYREQRALSRTQADRASSTAKAQSILSSLGSHLGTASTPDSETEKKAELAAFHRKVYKSQVQMDEMMSLELKRLGVPFFGTEPSLIVPDTIDVVTKEGSFRGNAKWSPVITESELIGLQRRMVTHLEDLYRD